MRQSDVTVTLGGEADEALRARLFGALRRLGATVLGPAGWVLAGSQVLEELDVRLDGRPLRVTAETYVGLSLSGPQDLVRQVLDLLAQP